MIDLEWPYFDSSCFLLAIISTAIQSISLLASDSDEFSKHGLGKIDLIQKSIPSLKRQITCWKQSGPRTEAIIGLPTLLEAA